MNSATVDRLVALRLIMAYLEGVSFDDAGTILQVRAKRLKDWLHEAQSVPGSKEAYLRLVLDRLRMLRSIISRDAVGWWFDLSVPALDDKSPIEALREGQSQVVWDLIESYGDPSFS